MADFKGNLVSHDDAAAAVTNLQRTNPELSYRIIRYRFNAMSERARFCKPGNDCTVEQFHRNAGWMRLRKVVVEAAAAAERVRKA